MRIIVFLVRFALKFIFCKFTVKDISQKLTHMPESTEKKSPFSDAKVKQNPTHNEEFWKNRTKTKKDAEKIQKFKKNNPATLNQPFDVQR